MIPTRLSRQPLLLVAGFFALLCCHHQVIAFSTPSFSNLHLQTSTQSAIDSQQCITILQARRPRDDDDDEFDEEDEDEEGGMFEFARVRRRGRRGRDECEEEYDEDLGRAADSLEARGIFDRLDDDLDDDDEEEEYGGIFANVVIPNSELDRIDPDGAAERFPELAMDPKFWFDMFLFLAFINFVSFIGPRNPYPDLIETMKNAQLPPPGI